MYINIIGIINQLSYGITTLNLIKTLSEQGHTVSFWPVYPNIQVLEEDTNLIFNCMHRTHDFPDYYAPSLRIWHQFDMAMSVGRGERVGWPIFELDKFTSAEQQHLNSLDRIIVCSDWAKRIILNNLSCGASRVEIVPLGVDQKIFYPEQNQDNHSSTIFFNIGKWEKRKGHDILIGAFNKAFTKKDDVQLIMCPFNYFIGQEGNSTWAKLYKESKLGDKITIMDRVQSQSDLAQIIRRCDCGVFPSRAEGFNLPLLESLACGKSVITTNYSAHTQYVNNNNAMLVHTNCMELAFDKTQFFNGQGQWAKLDLSHIDTIVEYMRKVHREKQENGFIKNKHGIDTANKFTWKNSTDILVKTLAKG